MAANTQNTNPGKYVLQALSPVAQSPQSLQSTPSPQTYSPANFSASAAESSTNQHVSVNTEEANTPEKADFLPPNHKTLDDLLREIQEETESDFPDIYSAGGTASMRSTSAGMHNISAYISPVTTPQPDERATANEIWESNLSPRQRVLPKLDIRMMVGVVSIFVLALGIGSTTFLVQQTQDIRQQAYEETLPEVTGPAATETIGDRAESESLALRGGTPTLQEQQQRLTQQITLFGGVVIGLGAFGLLAFLAWLFFA